jgi:hypothetical protein
MTLSPAAIVALRWLRPLYDAVHELAEVLITNLLHAVVVKKVLMYKLPGPETGVFSV